MIPGFLTLSHFLCGVLCVRVACGLCTGGAHQRQLHDSPGASVSADISGAHDTADAHCLLTGALLDFHL